MGEPTATARTRLVAPATNPFTMAMNVASFNDTLRVRLLSIAQAKHAPSTHSAGRPVFRRPAEHHRARDDAGHAERDAPVEVLLEDKPREQRREHALGIEQ